jgi:FemAB-related protein (PEP-CTERM system-associated)
MLAIPSKQRNTIRKGIKSGVKAEVDQDPARFYDVFAENMRDLGTPVFGRRYFENLMREFGDACEVLLVTKDGRPISGAMTFFFRNEMTPYYVGSRRGARELSAISFMYWEILNRAAARGCEIFDFSRSKRGTGSFDLKRHWGFEPEPLHYRYKLRKQSQLPNLNPLNRKYRQFIAIWKRLPIPVANMVGPMIVRDLG